MVDGRWLHRRSGRWLLLVCAGALGLSDVVIGAGPAAARPTTVLLAPSPGETVSGVMVARIQVTTPAGEPEPTQVQLAIAGRTVSSGIPVGSCVTSCTVTVSLDTAANDGATLVPDGLQYVMATAYNSDSGLGTTPVLVTVDNQRPTVWVTGQPPDTSSEVVADGAATISVSAVPGSGQTLDHISVMPDLGSRLPARVLTGPDWTYDVDTSALTVGVDGLALQAFDTRGRASPVHHVYVVVDHGMPFSVDVSSAIRGEGDVGSVPLTIPRARLSSTWWQVVRVWRDDSLVESHVVPDAPNTLTHWSVGLGTSPLPGGTHQYRFQVIDNRGVASTRTATVNVDPGPGITVTTPALIPAGSRTLQLRLTASTGTKVWNWTVTVDGKLLTGRGTCTDTPDYPCHAVEVVTWPWTATLGAHHVVVVARSTKNSTSELSQTITAVPAAPAQATHLAIGTRTSGTHRTFATRLATTSGAPIPGARVQLQWCTATVCRWQTAKTATTDTTGRATLAVVTTPSRRWRWYYAGSQGVYRSYKSSGSASAA